MKDSIKQIPGTQPAEAPRKAMAAVVPAALWVQILDLLRDAELPYKRTQPIMQQVEQVLPQEVTINP